MNDFDDICNYSEDETKRFKAINLIGEEAFFKIYDYLKIHRKLKTSENLVIFI